MVTQYISLDRNHPNAEYIQNAAEIIKRGGLVAFPTETVYGLGADALNPESTKKIYEAKKRPGDNPLIAHICDIAQVYDLASEFPEKAQKLAKRFWPGPMTLILPKSEHVPDQTTGGLSTVAVRMPKHEIALALIHAAGVPIAAPSANTSGRPSPTGAEHVLEDMQGRIEMILDGGEVEIGLESTIVDMTVDPPMILRPGAVTKEMLTECIGEVAYDEAVIHPDSTEKPKAPGMKYRHYAPKAKLIVVEGEESRVLGRILEHIKEEIYRGRTVGVILIQKHSEVIKEVFSEEISEGKLIFATIAQSNEEEQIARNLFGTLRFFDSGRAEIIYSESFAGEGLRMAIMNRLMKAAGQQRERV